MRLFAHARPAPVRHDWYYDADPLERREYDAFGPWLSPIRAYDEMPRRFQPWYEDLRSSVFLFKVPIDVERRAMRPGMDLYRSVLAIGEERVVVVEWDGSTATRREMAMNSIQAVRIDQDLLSSKLSLFLADGAVASMGYNSVSGKEMDSVVDFLRERMIACRGASREPIASASARSGSAIRDNFYLGMWEKQIRHFPSAQILHWEPPDIRCSMLRSSLGCLAIDEGGDLVIINRGRFVRWWHEVVYSDAQLYIPWAAIQGAELVQKPAGRKWFIPTLRLALSGHAVDLELFAPPSEVQQFLVAMARRPLARSAPFCDVEP